MTTVSKSNIFFVPDQLLKFAIENPSANINCSHLHDGLCSAKMVNQLISSSKGVWKMYLFVHLVPLLVFKRNKLLKSPKKQLKQFLKGYIFSLLFAGGYAALVRGIFCLVQKLYKCSGTLQCILGGMGGGISLWFEPVGRQTQIALFTVNKSAQALYNLALRRSLPVKLPHGQNILIGFSIAILCYHYLSHRQCIKKSYLTVLDKLLGQDI